uniref:UDP-N-acetylmuramoyl-tripeptide--D-alanyl-D-alanine ligase n=1 Tax=Magnetococcus massalia (strain MO-1) TaxID=451514 RepID=A0A1S7LKT8_MAGMO|nr:UDP-N-acetylmuramoyl-tripeptide--D-alanyl-D-alanine ligase [Candidatus Magnetococcus massalia]
MPHPLLTPELLATALPHAILHPALDSALPPCFNSISSDTRSLQPGALFVALSGPNFDANRFVPDAARLGAAGIIASRKPDAPLPCPLWVVEEPLQAMSQLALQWRRLLNPQIIGITGSSGKTTVKEMCGAILATRHRSAMTRGNLNNHIGVPLTLLSSPPDRTHLVVEMGMSAPGEIAHLAQLAEPDVGIITNIMAAHAGGFGEADEASTLDAIADAKGELASWMPPTGCMVLPADDGRFKRLRSKADCPVISFGSRASLADCSYGPISLGEAGMQFTLQTPHGEIGITLQAVGEHAVRNATAAAAACQQLGLPLQSIAQGLSRFQPGAGRGAIVKTASGMRLIDDTYNANPGAMEAAFQALSQLATPQHRVVVIGDMLELGEQSAHYHAGLAEPLHRWGIQRIFTAGPQMRALHDALSEQPDIQCHHQDDPAAWLGRLAAELSPQDTVLVKGSRGMRMERIVNDLK